METPGRTVLRRPAPPGWPRLRHAQAVRISQPLARQRVEGAHLRVGGRHARDFRCDGALLDDVRDRPMAQMELRDCDIVVVGAGQRMAQAGAPSGAPETR